MNPLHHTVSAHVPLAMLARAEAIGCDRAQLLADAALTESALDGQRILPAQFANLMRAVWRQSHDEFLGFCEHPSRVGTFPLMMHYALNADTLGEALRHSAHFYRVLTDDLTIQLTEQGEQAQLSLTLRRPDLDTQHVLTETILLCWYRFACWLINRRIRLHYTHFAYPAPAHEAEYHQLFPCPHHFDQDSTRLVFNRHMLTLPITRSSDELKALIRELPLGFFIKPVFQGSLGHRVRSLLMQKDSTFPDLDAVASALFLTGRSLRRKLQAEGTSFQLIKDDLRREYAMNLLRQPDTTLSDIASQLGFKDATVFIKAFKQWTGMTPGDYRAHLRRRG